jgi:vitamin B12 transporter
MLGAGSYTKSLFTAVFLGFGSFLHSQQDSLVIQLEEIVVVANRVEEPKNGISRSVTVITQEEIDRLPAANLGSLLSNILGVFTTGPGQTPGSLQTVSVRGSDNAHTVVLIDGVRISDPTSVDRALDYSEISLAGIERVEIIRGPTSQTYGTSAIGGAINLISSKSNTNGLHGQVMLLGGGFGAHTSQSDQAVNLSYGMGNGITFDGALFNSDINGIDASLSPPDETFRIGDMERFDKTDYHLGVRGNHRDVFWRFGFNEHTQQSDLDDGAYQDDENHTVSYERTYYDWQGRLRLKDGLNFLYQAGYHQNRRRIRDDSSTINLLGESDHSYFSADYSGKTMQHDLQLSWESEGLRVITGVNYMHEKMNFNTFFLNTLWQFEQRVRWDSIHPAVSNTGGFLKFSIGGRERDGMIAGMQVSGGIRIDHHSLTGSLWSGDLGIQYSFRDKTRIYGSWSTGYHKASLYQLFSPDIHYISGIKRGNENLGAEKSHGSEIGLTGILNHGWSYSLVMYHHRTERSIEFVYFWDRNISIEELGTDFLRDDFRGDRYINPGEKTSTGIEVDLKYQAGKWSAYMLGSYSSSKIKYGAGDVDAALLENYHIQLFSNGEFLVGQVEVKNQLRRPSIQSNAGLRYLFSDNIESGIHMRYVSKYRDVSYDPNLGPYGALGRTDLKDYVLMGLDARFKLNKSFSLYGGIDNLFDTQYAEVAGYRSKGRSFYIKLKSVF